MDPTRDVAFGMILRLKDIEHENTSQVSEAKLAWTALTERRFTDYLLHKANIQLLLGRPLLILARTPQEHYMRLLREQELALDVDAEETERTTLELLALIGEFSAVMGDLRQLDFTQWPASLFSIVDFMPFEENPRVRSQLSIGDFQSRRPTVTEQARLASGRWALNTHGQLTAVRIVERCSWFGIPYTRITRGDAVLTYFLGLEIGRRVISIEDS